MSSPPTSATILLVGNPGERHSLSLVAHFCVETIDGPRALERARDSHPDLIVAPLRSRDVDGVALCAAVRQDPALSCTAVALIAEEGRDSADVLRVLAAGADECVDASVESEILVARIAALIARRANEREAVARFHELELRATHLEAELRAVHKNAHQVEAIGRLAGGVAHNFNNLLTVVLVSSEMLMNDLEEGSPEWVHARETFEAASRAAGLTNQLLAFSRRQMLRPVDANLNTVVAELEPMLKETLGDQIELRVIPEPGLPPVYVDPSQMRRVVLDLAMHARDGMPHGGVLVMETRRVVLTEAYVADRVNVQPGVYVLLTISDTGPGMDVDTQLRLFEPFFTTKSAQGGSDLGLSTVYGIVKQSGGYIWVYSERGRGTTFKIYLPEGRTSHMGVTAPTVSQPLPRGQASVLLVDDEAGVRAAASRVLEGCGYHVVTAGSGEEALARCTDGGLEPDLVITDVVMPGLNGHQLVDRLRAQRAGLRVLYTSGFSAEAVVHHGVTAAEHFLSKPFTPSDLAHKVREVLGSN